MKHIRFMFATMAVFMMTASAALAQSSANRGDVVGVVYDPTGASLPNATVTITNPSTGLSRWMPVNAAGQYRFPRLDPGVYTLSGEAPNFATGVIDGIVVRIGSSIVIDLTLEVRETATTVDVSASLIDVSDAAASTQVPEIAIVNLPINGRRFQDFATLTPTVQIEPERSTLSFAGQRGVNGNVMLDGSDYNNPFFGGIRGGERANLIFTVPQGAVEQFQVVTTGYSPEYGRSSGGLLNVITKGGDNQWRGSAFWLHRRGDWSAHDPIFDLPATENQHQFGGTVGGPIVRDTLFFFGAAERQQAESPRRVVFDRLLGVTPDASQQEAFNFYRSLEEPFELTNDATALTARMDYQSRNGDRFTVRYNFSDAEGRNAVNTGNSLTPTTNRAVGNDGIEQDRTHTLTSSYARIVSPSLLNDLRVTYTYEERPRLANSTQPNVQTIIGNTGNRNFLPTTQDDYRLQFSNALSWMAGAHGVKFGVDYNYVHAAQEFGFNQFGQFDFSVPGTAAAATLETLELMSVGGPTPNRFDSPSVRGYSLQIGNLQASMAMHQAAFFLQDSWRATPEWTLNYGVRWEGQFNPQPEATNAALVNLLQGVRSPLGAALDPTQVPNAPHQWMPRLGFAWNPAGLGRRMVVRGHGGIFYASTPLLLYADASNNFRAIPGNLSVVLRPTSTMTLYDQFLSVGVDLNAFTLDNLPVLTVAQATQAFANANGVEPNPFAGAAVGFVATDFENPRSFQLGLGLDMELARATTAGVELQYVNTVHLQRNRDHNLPAPIVRDTDAARRPFYGLSSGRSRPIPSLGAFNVRESSGRGMYRGVTFKLEHRGSRLTTGAFYTLAETFSDDDNERSASGFQALDQFDLKQDYSHARIDVRHRFNGYAVYHLPLGFQVSAAFVARSGLPVNPTASGDPNQDFASFSDRPYAAPGAPMARMSFRNRAVVTANDLRILKSFNLGETSRIELSAEMFNLFNLDNVVYGSNFGDDNYGLGIDPATGAALAPDPGFRRLRLDSGAYDPANRQEGRPFQAQFGLRFFF